MKVQQFRFIGRQGKNHVERTQHLFVRGMEMAGRPGAARLVHHRGDHAEHVGAVVGVKNSGAFLHGQRCEGRLHPVAAVAGLGADVGAHAYLARLAGKHDFPFLVVHADGGDTLLPADVLDNCCQFLAGIEQHGKAQPAADSVAKARPAGGQAVDHVLLLIPDAGCGKRQHAPEQGGPGDNENFFRQGKMREFYQQRSHATASLRAEQL